jgi:hypothetical protein
MGPHMGSSYPPTHPTPWQVIDKRRLNMEVEDKDLLLEQLRKEIEILQCLSHPNIVAFQEVGVCRLTGCS